MFQGRGLGGDGDRSEDYFSAAKCYMGHKVYTSAAELRAQLSMQQKKADQLCIIHAPHRC